VDNWNDITNSPIGVRKKSFGGTFCFSNCHIIRLDTGGLVFLVSGSTIVLSTYTALRLSQKILATPEFYGLFGLIA
jgi:hypothetical protein